jgi:hypothetical protein
MVGVGFALFTLGYILGVWTVGMVFRRRQRGYEEDRLRPNPGAGTRPATG